MSSLSTFGFNPQYADKANIRATEIEVDDLSILNSLSLVGNLDLDGDATVTGKVDASYVDAEPTTDPVVKGKNSTFTSNIWDVDVEGDLAVAVAFSSDRFATYDVSDPSNPEFLGEFTDNTTMDDPTMVRLKGDYAYVVTGDNVNRFLTVMDVSDPTTPVRFGFVADPATYLDGCEGLEIQGKYAYITGGDTDYFSVWDIGDPANPSFVSAFTDVTMDHCSGIAIKGKYAFVAGTDNDAFVTIDISDPQNPTLVASLVSNSNLDGVYKISVDGYIAYCTCRSGDTLTLVDISDPLACTVISTVATQEYPWKVEICNKLAYVSCKDSDSLQVIDVSDRTSPVVLRTLTDVANIERPQGFRVQGNYLYLGTGDAISAVVVIDLLGSSFAHMEVGTARLNKATVTGEMHVQGSANFQNGIIVGTSGAAVHGDMGVSGSLRLAKGAVTQATSITTGVAISENQGVITTVSSTLAASSTATFTVTNTKVFAADVVVAAIVDYGGSAGIPGVIVSNIAAGSFDVIVSNSHGTNALDGTLGIFFRII